MTFLVFSVFPAPDSPLRGGTKGNKKGQQCSEVSPAHSKQSHSQPGPRFLQEVLQDYSRAENGLILTICRGQRGTCHLGGFLQRDTGHPLFKILPKG